MRFSLTREREREEYAEHSIRFYSSRLFFDDVMIIISISFRSYFFEFSFLLFFFFFCRNQCRDRLVLTRTSWHCKLVEYNFVLHPIFYCNYSSGGFLLDEEEGGGAK